MNALLCAVKMLRANNSFSEKNHAEVTESTKSQEAVNGPTYTTQAQIPGFSLLGLSLTSETMAAGLAEPFQQILEPISPLSRCHCAGDFDPFTAEKIGIIKVLPLIATLNGK
ncbi:hypothetical protein DKX38_027452 [Salix brachista]|uniref:Uncharacterized protein n=1 Tax=Salix brachista TaxID=2182728 RepID=A0A5N5JFM6_9ROSI|nr:hypothetical protein DKX38_027452 [Salix brachista]